MTAQLAPLASDVNTVALGVLIALFLLVTVLGFLATRFRRGAGLDSLDEWGLGGRKFGTSRPLPKLSAASASRRIGRIWLRRNRTATIRRIEEVPSIQKMKISELEA